MTKPTDWLNYKKPIHKFKDIEKPCYSCGYCPYGQLVEAFQLEKRTKISCTIFGHDCPAYYMAEGMTEKMK
jgi:hypothetical protein